MKKTKQPKATALAALATVTKVRKGIVAVTAKPPKPPTKMELRAQAKNLRRVSLLVNITCHVVDIRFPLMVLEVVRTAASAGLYLSHEDARDLLVDRIRPYTTTAEASHGLPIDQGSRVPPHPGGKGPAQPAVDGRGAPKARRARADKPLFK